MKQIIYAVGGLLLLSGVYLTCAPLNASIGAGVPDPIRGETIYLPAIISADASPTPTATPVAGPTSTPATPAWSPTPTPKPTGTSVPAPLLTVPNGDFEAGPGQGWNEFSPDGQVIISDPLNAGGWYVRLGGHHNLGETPNWQSKIGQNQWMTLPAGQKIYLHFVYQIISEETPDREGLCVRDLLNFWVNTPSTSILHYQAQICDRFNTQGWTPAVIEISSFAGWDVAFEFEMRTNFDAVSVFLLDDLVLRSTP